MAWVEQSALRTKHAKTWRDDLDPTLHHLSTVCGVSLHYETAIDGGVYGSPVDMQPAHVTAGGRDLWRVTAADWHYALGLDVTGDLADKDGAVGFGGRQGAHWFKFRLTRIGYMHWSTRSWQDVGGAPTYSRANLSQSTRTVSVGPAGSEVTVNADTLATWTGIWTTPGGGSLDAVWRFDGKGIKEELRLNQVAREWIAANEPPTTPAGETWFGFVFQVDVSDVPKAVVNGSQQNLDGDFTDDAGAIQFQDASDRLLCLMPIDAVWSEPYGTMQRDSVTLRKRVWLDGDGNHYLLVGARVDLVNAMQDGSLTFDPTINAQVGAGGDDGRWQLESGHPTYYANNEASIAFTYTAGTYEYVDLWARFSSVQFSGTPTVTTATLSLHAAADASGDPGDPLVDAVDSDDPSAPASAADADGRTRTTANVTWNLGSWTSGTWYSPGDLSAVVQEIADSYNYVSSAKAILIYVESDGTGSDSRTATAYDGTAANAPKLDIDYTVAGGGNALPMAMSSYRRRRAA